jgi:hypothetical protein
MLTIYLLSILAVLAGAHLVVSLRSAGESTVQNEYKHTHPTNQRRFAEAEVLEIPSYDSSILSQSERDALERLTSIKGELYSLERRASQLEAKLLKLEGRNSSSGAVIPAEELEQIKKKLEKLDDFRKQAIIELAVIRQALNIKVKKKDSPFKKKEFQERVRSIIFHAGALKKG